MTGRHKREYILEHQTFSETRVPLFDFHVHTSWTDGADDVETMFAGAMKCGIRSVLFSEHARTTSESWFHDFAEQVRSLPHGHCRAHVGVETKAKDLDGNLDCSRTILNECDLVIGSVHRFPGETEGLSNADWSGDDAIELEFRLSSALLENPNVDILGHPFGMTYRRFKTVPPREMLVALIEKAARKGVAFEVNARYHPDPWDLIRTCREKGAMVSLGSDAHTVLEIGRITRILEGRESAWNPSVF